MSRSPSLCLLRSTEGEKQATPKSLRPRVLGDLAGIQPVSSSERLSLSASQPIRCSVTLLVHSWKARCPRVLFWSSPRRGGGWVWYGMHKDPGLNPCQLVSMGKDLLPNKNSFPCYGHLSYDLLLLRTSPYKFDFHSFILYIYFFHCDFLMLKRLVFPIGYLPDSNSKLWPESRVTYAGTCSVPEFCIEALSCRQHLTPVPNPCPGALV